MSTELVPLNAGALELLSSAGYGAGLHDCLSSRPEKKYLALTAFMNDPQYSALPWATVCALANVTPQEIEQVWVDYSRRQSVIRLANHLPKITEDLAEDAKASWKVCKNCRGTGVLEREPEMPPCPMCDGSGKIRQPGDPKARELVFEAMKLTAKENAVVVNQNFNFEGLVNEAARILKVPDALDVSV